MVCIIFITGDGMCFFFFFFFFLMILWDFAGVGGYTVLEF